MSSNKSFLVFLNAQVYLEIPNTSIWASRTWSVISILGNAFPCFQSSTFCFFSDQYMFCTSAVFIPHPIVYVLYLFLYPFHSPQMSEVQAQQQSSQQSSSSSSMSSVTTATTTAADRSSLSSAPSASTASSSTSTGETQSSEKQSSEKQDQDTTKVNDQFLSF